MRGVLIAITVLTATVHADPHATTTLTLSRGKTKPARLLAKKVEVDVVRPLTPCALKLVIESQHTLFKRFTIDVGYEAISSGSIKNGRGPVTAEIVVVGEANPIATKRGHVDIMRRTSNAFDVKVEVTFDHGNSPWTLSGVVRVEDAACRWDMK